MSELEILNALLMNRSLPEGFQKNVREEFFTIAIQLERIESLVCMISNPNLRLEESGITLLEYSIRWGKREIVLRLLELGADPNLYYYRPLLMETRDLQTFKYLLAYGANPDIQDRQGRTALMKASSLAFMEELVRYGAELDLQDREGKTALHYFCRNEIVKQFLVAVGARKDIDDMYDSSLLTS